jgi:hypothetical protein
LGNSPKGAIMPRNLVFLVLGVMSALLLGCSTQAGTQNFNQDNLDAATLASQLPPLPLPHSASVLIDFVQPGNNAFARHASAVDEGTSLRLPSVAGGICWGVWGFGSATEATNCRVDFSGDAGAEAYFAIADFVKGTWEIGGPLAGPEVSMAIDSPNYISGAGDLFIAVIAFDGASILVDQLALTTDIPPVQKDIELSGGYTAMAMVNGQPAISFYDDVNHDLRYVRAADPFGASWAPAVTPDSAGDTGQWTSLKVVDGFPAIAYYDYTNKDLRYVRALDANGAAWGSPITVDGAGLTGEYCSLEVVAGQPAISYYYYDGPALKFVRALDSTGATWGTPLVVDNSGNTGQESCLAIVNGLPAISYRNGGGGELRYVRGSNAEGTAWEAPLVLDTINNTGFSSSLVVVNTFPAISYYDGTDADLRYIRALDVNGDTWSAPLTLDGQTDAAGDYSSMAIIGGKPAITYYNGLNGDLRYIQALDVNGATWGSGVVLDDTSNITGRDTFLMDVYGAPGVSYYDVTNGKLRYMWGF